MTHWSSAITKDNWMNICTDFCLNYNISNCRQLWGYFHISLWNLGNKKVLHTNEPLESIKLKLTESGDYVYETSEVQHIFFTNVENTEPSYFEKDNLNCTSIYVSPKTDKEYFINLVKDYLICRGQTDIEIA